LKAELESPKEDWSDLIPEPGHSLGRLTLYTHSIHIFWLMKCIMAKDMVSSLNIARNMELNLGLKDI